MIGLSYMYLSANRKYAVLAHSNDAILPRSTSATPQREQTIGLTVAKLRVRMRVATIDFKKRAFSDIPHITSIHSVS